MKKLILTASLLIGSIVSANSQALHLTYAPGGTAFTVMSFLKEDLDKKGYNIDLKSLGNCALTKHAWETTKDKFITMYDDDLNSKKNTACNLNVKDTEFVKVFYQAYLYFCSVPGKDVNLWNTKGSKFTVGYGGNMPVKSLLKYLNEKNGTDAKAVTYKNSGALATGIAAKEIDYAFSHAGPSKIIAEGGKCYWGTAPENISSNGIPNIKKIYPDTPFGELSINMWIIAKNFTPEEIKKLRADVTDFMRNNEQYKKLLASREVSNPVDQSDADIMRRIEYMKTVSDMP